ncbi:type IV secretion system protein [Bartonella raoultii]|uniref:Conjugal transfer protein n=1 Tax=Bartonella raoultii TaxID=1457020 RepID=A0ABS7I657_9HYPH|nr:type IV secretion system protein [Bartonella raoultii]MBX4335905.1 conjugal transfer protein [Bartonella raoultii]
MKKQIISIAMAIILGSPSSAMAFNWFLGAGAADLSRVFPSFPAKPSSPPKAPASKPTQKLPPPKKHPLEYYVLLLLSQQLDIQKEQLEEAKKTSNSITGNKKIDMTQTDYGSFFLKTPETIYKRNKHKNYENDRSDISLSVAKILNEEELSNSAGFVRRSIAQRFQYGAAIDKAISLQTFEETEKRFQHISDLLKKIEKTEDLKSIAELQTYVNSMLAMIQNENAKFKMVAHLRNAEYTLINHQRHKHNIKIFSSTNKGMPRIKSIR